MATIVKLVLLTFFCCLPCFIQAEDWNSTDTPAVGLDALTKYIPQDAPNLDFTNPLATASVPAVVLSNDLCVSVCVYPYSVSYFHGIKMWSVSNQI